MLRPGGVKQKKDPAPEAVSTVGWEPEVGDRKTFVPGAWLATGAMRGVFSGFGTTVTGTVVRVYQAHRMVRVRYETPCGTMHECFKY